MNYIYDNADNPRNSKHFPQKLDEILECSAHGKRPNVEDFTGKLKPRGAVFTTTDECKSSCAMDLTWAVTRLSMANLFTAEDPTREDDASAVCKGRTNRKLAPSSRSSLFNASVFLRT